MGLGGAHERDGRLEGWVAADGRPARRCSAAASHPQRSNSGQVAADLGHKWSNSSIARPCGSQTRQSPTSLTRRVASQGATPLHLAARKGHTAMAEALMAKGADVNAKDVSGRG